MDLDAKNVAFFYVAGVYESEYNYPNKIQSEFEFVLFVIRLGLIELTGTVGPWWTYALY